MRLLHLLLLYYYYHTVIILFFYFPCAVEDDIHRKENDLIETRRQKGILSARAIEQGWLQDLEAKAIEMRGELTQMKLKFCFEKVPLLRGLEV